jgi:hypothetical protein
MPCKAYSFKTIGNDLNDPRMACLKKLEQAGKQFGFNATAAYQVQPSKVEEDSRFEFPGRLLASHLPEEPTKLMKLYMKLS